MKFVAVFVLFSCTLNGFQSVTNSPEFTERFRWAPVDYAFQEAGLKLNRTSYNLWDFAVNNVHPWKEKLFLIQTSLLFQPNAPKIPLAYVDLKSPEKSPLLIPYPKNSVNSLGFSRTLHIDICDRLWYIDYEHPTLYIIDLNQNQIIRNVTLGHPRLRYIIIKSLTVDANKSDCDNAHAYMVLDDTAIMVYRLKDDQYWTAGKPTYINLKNENLKLPFSIGLSHIGVVDLNGNGNRVLFAQPFRHSSLFTISLDTLRNSENVTSYLELTAFGFRGENQSSDLFHYDHRNSILFYNIAEESTFGCWNAKRFPNEFSSNTTHGFKSSNVNFNYLLDMQSDSQDNLLVVTRHWDNEYPYIIYLHTINIKNLVKDTVCDVI